MSLTVYTGLSGSGKSRRLIEAVRSARDDGRPAHAFACSESSVLRARKEFSQHRVLCCRIEGLTCPLDFFVDTAEAITRLETLPEGSLAAFDEAQHFSDLIVNAWTAASQRGLQVIVATPSASQVNLLKALGHKPERLARECDRCAAPEAARVVTSTLNDTTRALCSPCYQAERREVLDDVLARLQEQPPHPGERCLYQPVEPADGSWQVIREDSERRWDLMWSVLERTGLELEGRTCVDLGCHTGYFCHHFARTGLQVTGVDVTRMDLEIADQLSAYERHDHVQYRPADAYDYLETTHREQADIVSALSVVPWIMQQRGEPAGWQALRWLFAKTRHIMFLEVGQPDEAHYSDIRGALEPATLRRFIDEHGDFDEVLRFDLARHNLKRDLYVGLRGCSASSSLLTRLRSLTPKEALWQVTRALYKAVPAPVLKQRAKALFYGLYGRVYPESPRYHQFLRHEAFLLSRSSNPLPDGEGPPEATLAPPPPGPGPWTAVVFSVIDWHFRIQRPQHLCRQLAGRGHRVLYLNTRFSSKPEDNKVELTELEPNIFGVTLPCPDPRPSIYHDALDHDQVTAMTEALAEVIEAHCGAVVAIVEHPFWFPVANLLRNARLVYDCIDLHSGFSVSSPEALADETRLLGSADAVVVTARSLESKLPRVGPTPVIIENAVEFEHFSGVAATQSSERPIIGYIGAIAEWFDSELVAFAAEQLPQFDFELIGATAGANLEPLRDLPNVRLLGEIPYAHVPQQLARIDVCMIPFRLTELTQCTNPVKAYEYLAAGKPVVSVRLPEMERLGDLVDIADNPESFVVALRKSVEDTSPDHVDRRQSFASRNTWEDRGRRLVEVCDPLFAPASVIVLTYNQLDFTRQCLSALERLTAYPRWELIIVDNASTDGTPEFLQEFAESRSWVTPVLNAENTGFAAGCNLGAEHASGEFLVLMNNDTYVTRGWLGDLLAHFRDEPMLGLLGPVTNNIGNEARIDIHYRDMAEMVLAAKAYTAGKRLQRRELQSIAFFCAATPRALWEEVGGLDVAYGMGFFEDDDYAMRAHQSGFHVAVADDVFVHHHLSASFDHVDQQERDALFERNRRYFESKWGKWREHRDDTTPRGPRVS